MGDALGHRTRRNPARLGVTDQTAVPQTQLQTHLGQLGGLAGTGLTRDHHDLVIADRGHNVLPARADGEVVRVHDAGLDAGLSHVNGRVYGPRPTRAHGPLREPDDAPDCPHM